MLNRIHTHDLLVGDVVLIEEGMEIPADGWIIQSHDVKIDESQITGENQAITKDSYESIIRARESGSLPDLNQLKAITKLPSAILLSGSKV